MTREALIDAIRRELIRQAEGKRPLLTLQRVETPDAIGVRGVLDIDKLAKAIRDE